jgi:hypothetical protein
VLRDAGIGGCVTAVGSNVCAPQAPTRVAPPITEIAAASGRLDPCAPEARTIPRPTRWGD